MTEIAWSQMAIDSFFANHEPSINQAECDRIALAISGAARVRSVASPGSMSYTVVCTDRKGSELDLVVSFRETGASLDDVAIRLAKQVHGALVPQFTYHDTTRSSPPLLIYSMTYLPGVSCLDVQIMEVSLNPQAENSHLNFIRHLAR